MSGSNNFPFRIALEGGEDVKRQVRELGETFAQTVQKAERLPTPVARASEAFGALESRAQAGRRALTDLSGAMELVGAGGVAGVLGPVASQLGNVADAFSTAGLAARAGTSALGLAVPVLGALAAAATAGYAAYQALAAQAALYGTEQERLNVILGFATEAQDSYRRAVEATDVILVDAEQRAIALANARRREAFETLKAAEAANALAQAEAGRRAGNLSASMVIAEEDPGAYAAMGFAGQSPRETAERRAFLEEQLRLVNARAAELADQAADLARRRAELGDEMGSIQSNAPFGPALPPSFGREPNAGRGAGGAAPRDTLDRDFDRSEQLARRAAEQTMRAGQATKNLGRDVVQTNAAVRDLGLTFSSAFEDAVANGRSLQDVLRGIEQDLLRIGTRRLVTEPLVGAVSSFLSPGGGTFDWMKLLGSLGGFVLGGGAKAGGIDGLGINTFSGAATMTPRVMHSGGIVGEDGGHRFMPPWIWNHAQRFHRGGWPGLPLGPDEVPVIAQKGERILSRREVAAGAGGSVHITINATDAASFRASKGQIAADLTRAVARGRRQT